MFTRNLRARAVERIGQFEDNADNSESVLEVPEDVTTLSDEEVETLLSRATDAFSSTYGDGSSEFSAEELESLEELTGAIETLRGEKEARSAAAQERTSKAADFAVRVNGETVSEDDATDVDVTTTDDTEDADTASAESEELSDNTNDTADEDREEVTASGAQKKARRVKLSNLKSRQRAPKVEDTNEGKLTERDMIVASANVPGVEAGSGLTFSDTADIIENRLKSFNKGTFDAARRSGRQIKQQMSVATIRRHYDDAVTVNNDSETEGALSAAVDESRLPGGSLVASGGWCAPSETIYDFMETETREGLFSIPEINVARGGLRYTTGPDFTSLFADLQTGSWDVSEDEDIAGDYQNTGEQSDKPCLAIDCPDFTEERLRLTGLCLSAGLLQQRGYPELIARTVRGTLVAHDHLTSGKLLDEIEAGSTAVTMPSGQVGATAPILTALDLQAQHYRTVSRMSPNASLEGVFPMWTKGLLRADLSRRLGVDMIDVSEQRIMGWFAERGINPQFVYNFNDLSGDASALTAYPEEVTFLLYAAGTWVRGAQDVITLDTVYDSDTLRQNDYTALFTEEGYMVVQRGHDSRAVTVPVCANGSTNIGELIACDGTAAADSGL